MSRYDMKIDRKTLKRNIDYLIDAGFPITGEKPESWRTGTKTTLNPETGEAEETEVISELFYEHDFTTSELRILADALLFSNFLPLKQCQDLVGKLTRLSNRYFIPRIKHIFTLPDNLLPQNKQLAYTIEVLGDAIDSGKMVRFNYYHYGADKDLHLTRENDGSARVYDVSPYQMAYKGGKPYVICNIDWRDNIAHYRIDRIANIRILHEKSVEFESLDGSGGQPLDLGKYIVEHPIMWAAVAVGCKFRAKRGLVDVVIDTFSRSVEFDDDGGEFVTVSARSDKQSMVHFAKEYAPDVLILEPKEWSEDVRGDCVAALDAYKNLEKRGI